MRAVEVSSRRTSISRQATCPIPVPRAFAAASFAAKRAANEGGIGASFGQLQGGKNPGQEALSMDFDRNPDALNLNDIHTI